ncbi:hypothetical protein K2X05_13020 [bacterium]|nr:hypothetical protein [bacterium]
MSRNFKSFLFIAVVLLSTLLLIKGNEQKNLQTTTPPTEEMTKEEAEVTTISPSAVDKQEISPLPSRIQNKITQFPQDISAKYEKSIAKEPHQTPEVVLQGALQLGEIFDLVKNEKDASEAFDFFAKCVANENVVALQTACFRYARDLAKNYSSLNENFQSLEQKTSSTILKIVRFD